MWKECYFPYTDDYLEKCEINESLIDFVKCIEKMYSRMADDISRRIFSNRLMYSLTLDFDYVHNILLDTKQGSKLEELLEAKQKDGIYIYGAGIRGKRIAEIYNNINWLGYIDKSVYEGKFNGLPVIKLEQFDYRNNTTVLISNQFNSENIKRDLMDYGIPENQIITLSEYDELAEINEYFEPFILNSMPLQGAFIDAGCYDGMTSINYQKVKHKFNINIFAFEPDPANYISSKENLKNYDNVKLFPYGLSDTQGIKKFVYLKNEKSRVSEEGKIQINMVTLDQMIGNEQIEYMKVDVEGEEIRVLHGASDIIRNQQPKCAICIYHKRQDIWTLPQLLLELNPNYKFYLRHYSVGVTDTVLYAVNER